MAEGKIEIGVVRSVIVTLLEGGMMMVQGKLCAGAEQFQSELRSAIDHPFMAAKVRKPRQVKAKGEGIPASPAKSKK